MKNILLILICIGILNSWSALAEINENAHSHDWDILIFTQSWPLSACIPWEEKHKSCLEIEKWTVHGVWPTKYGTIGPGFCNKTWHFNEKELQPIMKDLETNWPNVMNGTEEDALWKHEWEKHGTCAAQLPSLNTEMKYFTQGLKWHNNYDLKNALKNQGIYPTEDRTYIVQDIWKAIKKYVKTDPAIECLEDKETGKTYLMEIRICFDKRLNLIDCDGIKANGGDIITNCPLNSKIIYPNTLPVIGRNNNKFRNNNNKKTFTWREFFQIFLWTQMQIF